MMWPWISTSSTWGIGWPGVAVLIVGLRRPLRGSPPGYSTAGAGAAATTLRAGGADAVGWRVGDGWAAEGPGMAGETNPDLYEVSEAQGVTVVRFTRRTIL